MKKFIVVTGGAGFVGTNLISYLITKSKLNIISLDDYSSGNKKNHIKSKRIVYLKGNTKNIDTLLKRYKKKIHSIFHFGEFSRIYQSFLQMNKCIQSNSIGSHAVFDFCLKNNIRLVYSATSASLGNKGKDKDLSPYAFTKAKNLELLNNLRKWFNFKYEVIFFYNVYGPGQIKAGEMSTVIGIFEDQFLKNKPLTVVRPGTQSRRFTHITDTVRVCYKAWKKNKCRFYSISNRKSFTILEVARMFGTKIKFLSARKGERYASALTTLSLSKKIYRNYGNISLKKYIDSFKKEHQK
tara:strand:- start:308 stop:1195 length:888 start_codon:yes stop_codon:yes gene_type:complete